MTEIKELLLIFKCAEGISVLLNKSLYLLNIHTDIFMDEMMYLRYA